MKCLDFTCLDCGFVARVPSINDNVVVNSFLWTLFCGC